MANIQLIIGIVLAILSIIYLLKTASNIAISGALCAVLIASTFLVFGEIPNVDDVPVLNKLIATKDKVVDTIIPEHKLTILTTNSDLEGNLLIAVKNEGRSEYTEVLIIVNGDDLEFSSPCPLEPKETCIIKTEYKSKAGDQVMAIAGEVTSNLVTI